MRINGLRGPEDQARGQDDDVTCRVMVVDWDRIGEHVVEDGIPKCHVILGAEVIHHVSHATGVYKTIR